MSIEDVLNNKTAWHIECADAVAGLRSVPANSVHLCCTSPPYYGLRAYSKEASTAELGREKVPDCGLHTTPAWVREKYGLKTCGECYVCRIVAVCEEIKRVLRDDGVFFLNLGDSYWGSWGNYKGEKRGGGTQRPINKGSRIKNEAYDELADWRPQSSFKNEMFKNTSLIGIPWRVALALQASGWLLRMDCLWVKTSPMPSSVFGWQWERCRVKAGPCHTHEYGGKNGVLDTRENAKRLHNAAASARAAGAPHGKCSGMKIGWKDCPGCDKCKAHGGFVLRRGSWRPTTAHEYIFMFAKGEKYFVDGYAVRQRLAEATIMRDRYTRVLDDPDEQFAVAHDHESVSNPDDGANLRSWLVLPGENFSGKHYAVFPPSLPALAIKCGTSEKGVCPHCGAQWARMVQRKPMGHKPGGKHEQYWKDQDDCTSKRMNCSGIETEPATATTLGWRQTCKCPEHEPIGAVVLDPFCGAATSIVAARRLGRRAIGLELYEENVRLGRERIQSDCPLFNTETQHADV